MLQNGGNAWLGMLYGETAKLGWGKSDPHAIWKLWDTFGMTNSEMIGYWDPACPVHTTDENVLATVYHQPDRTLIVLGNFSEKPATFHLKLDSKMFGKGVIKMTAPEIEKLQKPAEFQSDQEFTLDPKRGLFLIAPSK